MQDKPIQPTLGYNHLLPGHPDNLKRYPVCGAKTRNVDAQSDHCQNKAGLRTAHPGVGRCFLHSGRSLAGPDNPRWKGGRYAHLYKGRIAERVAAMGASDDNPMDLLPELEAQRVLVGLAVDALVGTLGSSMQSVDVRNDSSGSVARRGDLTLSQEGDGETTPSSNEEEDYNEPPPRSQQFPIFPPDVSTPVLITNASEHIPLAPLSAPNIPLSPPASEDYVKLDVRKILLEMDTLSVHIDRTMKIVESIQRMRSDQTLGKAELLYLMGAIKRLVEEYIPDVDRRRKFFKDLKKETGL